MLHLIIQYFSTRYLIATKSPFTCIFPLALDILFDIHQQRTSAKLNGKDSSMVKCNLLAISGSDPIQILCMPISAFKIVTQAREIYYIINAQVVWTSRHFIICDCFHDHCTELAVTEVLRLRQ